MALDSVMYTTEVTVTGGREGAALSADGRLNLKLTAPTAQSGDGTNPEQLFAAGYGACFLSALSLVAKRNKTPLGPDAALTASVSLGKIGEDFALAVVLDLRLPGMEKAQAESLAALAHQVCPYSRATRNNIEVQLKVTVDY